MLIDSHQLFGTYPEAGASQQQIALDTFSQKAWTGFAKNLPVDQVGSLSERVAKMLDIGGNGSIGGFLIRKEHIDFICPLLKPINEIVGY
jgi:hypothetical protein